MIKSDPKEEVETYEALNRRFFREFSRPKMLWIPNSKNDQSKFVDIGKKCTQMLKLAEKFQ